VGSAPQGMKSAIYGTEHHPRDRDYGIAAAPRGQRRPRRWHGAAAIVSA
jgi:hypothetical protein